MPFFHEAGVALEFVDLDAAHFLFAHGGYLLVLAVGAGSHTALAVLLLLKFGQMRLHVELLLGLVKSIDARLEELVLNSVVLFLGHRNFLGRLVISKLARFRQYSDICCRVDLFQYHFELV